jgi:hypothetical protein
MRRSSQILGYPCIWEDIPMYGVPYYYCNSDDCMQVTEHVIIHIVSKSAMSPRPPPTPPLQPLQE